LDIQNSKVLAKIIKNMHHSPKISRIGEIVTVLRPATHNKVWVRLESGTELVWAKNCLQIIEKDIAN
jgi:hypothetical protein